MRNIRENFYTFILRKNLALTAVKPNNAAAIAVGSTVSLTTLKSRLS
ncbi:hypothetical protein [Nostoc sp. MG11]|nr:hypothetical protein [Nostoc sp. MG11]